jgi:hypothetical protein
MVFVAESRDDSTFMNQDVTVVERAEGSIQPVSNRGRHVSILGCGTTDRMRRTRITTCVRREA